MILLKQSVSNQFQRLSNASFSAKQTRESSAIGGASDNVRVAQQLIFHMNRLEIDVHPGSW